MKEQSRLWECKRQAASQDILSLLFNPSLPCWEEWIITWASLIQAVPFYVYRLILPYEVRLIQISFFPTWMCILYSDSLSDTSSYLEHRRTVNVFCEKWRSSTSVKETFLETSSNWGEWDLVLTAVHWNKCVNPDLLIIEFQTIGCNYLYILANFYPSAKLVRSFSL